ncbi:hypothetical protein GPALN_004452 [Globodera pallida]|nr:hypothetical protein GPALN_004452 [Globodera pallida]
MIDTNFREELSRIREKVEDLYTYEGNKVFFMLGVAPMVYKAILRNPPSGMESSAFALKLIEGQGFSMSACREVALLRELNHPNLIKLLRVFLTTEKRVWLLFDYAEHDLWHIIKYHRSAKLRRQPVMVPKGMVKSLLYQILDGIYYLHNNWIMHRDLKPANILVMGEETGIERGRVKIADMGSVCSRRRPYNPSEDNPSVANPSEDNPSVKDNTSENNRSEDNPSVKHNTSEDNRINTNVGLPKRYHCLFCIHDEDLTAIDIWAIGCIFAELLTSEPIFVCREGAVGALGYPKREEWPDMLRMPGYEKLKDDFAKELHRFKDASLRRHMDKHRPGDQAFSLLERLLTMDPLKRITAAEAKEHKYFKDSPAPTSDVFSGCDIPYPKREFLKDEPDDKNSGSKQQAPTLPVAVPPTVPAHTHNPPTIEPPATKKLRQAPHPSMGSGGGGVMKVAPPQQMGGGGSGGFQQQSQQQQLMEQQKQMYGSSHSGLGPPQQDYRLGTAAPPQMQQTQQQFSGTGMGPQQGTMAASAQQQMGGFQQLQMYQQQQQQIQQQQVSSTQQQQQLQIGGHQQMGSAGAQQQQQLMQPNQPQQQQLRMAQHQQQGGAQSHGGAMMPPQFMHQNQQQQTLQQQGMVQQPNMSSAQPQQMQMRQQPQMGGFVQHQSQQQQHGNSPLFVAKTGPIIVRWKWPNS